ncbi:MAG: neuraminidase-like domain-containing protein, partial [Rivularia sp. (in: cyanobacteria)]
MTNSKNDWSILSKQLHDELNEIKRDALVPYVISIENEIENPQDLYEKLLIDVEMCSCGTTSKIKEAIAATQLYFHRYFVNLEELKTKGNQDEEEVKKQLKEYWKWMRNYRVWEANRKVFLYPENYIRPELRDTKTPAFKTLEEDLLQGEITEASVQRAYKKYLDEYTEVSRLTIAGGYVYNTNSNEDEKNLVLFGKTKTDPRRYYYRFAKFMSDSVRWDPWLSVNVQIDADRVYPIYAFGRVFVFWTKVETLVEDTNSTNITTKQKGNTQSIVSNRQETECIKIFYSFYNLNQEWVSPQQLAEEIKIKDVSWDFFNFELEFDFEVFDVRLFVENSEDLMIGEDTAKHENIVINCTYNVRLQYFVKNNDDDVIGVGKPKEEERNAYFILTPELYTQNIERNNSNDNQKASLVKATKTIVNDIFEQSEIDINKMVMFNTLKGSSDAPWFSFDQKGGSFLCKPTYDYTPEDFELKDILEQLNWKKKDIIAVKIPNGTIYLFNRNQYVTVENNLASGKKDIRERWGKVSTNIAKTCIVDAALFDGNKTYLFSGKEYLVYSTGNELADFGYPKLLENNNEGLPKWDQIDAAFRKDGKNYFFTNKPDNDPKFVISDAMEEEKSTKEFWGKSKDNFTSLEPNKHLVDAAFIFGDYTYLVNESYFIKYENNDYDFVELGYPKRHTFYSVLEDLECQNNKNTYKGEKIYAASDVGSDIYFLTTADKYVFSAETREVTQLDESDGSSAAIFAIDDVTYKFKRKNPDNETDKKQQLFVDNRKNPIDIPEKDEINAAFVGKDDKIYLFNRTEYISFPKEGITAETIIEKIRGWDDIKQSIKDKWGKETNNIAETGIIDAAFYDANQIYLFSGNQYFVYSGDDEQINDGYPKAIDKNTENLPNWNEINAVLTTNENGKKYFFNNKDKTFVDSVNLNNSITTAEKWGRVSNNFTKDDAKVEKAYASSNGLYLVNDNQYITYTLSETEINEPGEYITGYPQSFNKQVENTLKSNYEIIRLTTSTAYKLNETLFAGGIPSLLSLATQEIDDIPAFSFDRLPLTTRNAATTIKVIEGRVHKDKIPVSSHLDFNSANGIYYWEIFFHAPFLIAQSLNTAQKFEEAKEWYEYIFDPTEKASYWKFLPFLAVDIQGIITSGKAAMVQLQNKNYLDVTIPKNIKEDFTNLFKDIARWKDVFRQNGKLPGAEETKFREYIKSYNGFAGKKFPSLHNPRKKINPLKSIQANLVNWKQPFPKSAQNKKEKIELFNNLKNHLHDLAEIIGKLWNRYQLMNPGESEIHAYLKDPFDPHAIASLRKIAYRRAIVMAYIDNILDWGDMLFQQYTHESINEARMLYILAYDLLGQRPENLGRMFLSEDRSYENLAALEGKEVFPINNKPVEKSRLGALLLGDENYDFLVYPSGTPNESVVSPYFYVPENTL